MTHISRPFQIALVALLLFIALWFAVLRGHSSSTESSGSGSSASSTASSAGQSAASQSAASSSAPGGGSAASQASGAQHSSAPGVDGLSRAIQRARGAVAQSQQSAGQLHKSSEQASSSSQPHSAQSQNAQTQSAAQSHGASQSKAQAQQRSHATAKPKTTTKTQPSGSAQAKTKTASGAPAMQVKVEGELQHGKIVAVLFWNPKGSVDAVVRRELQTAKHDSHGKLAIHVARSGEVGSFGSFTHTVQVYSTPTILLINTKGQTSSLTGLTDAFSIEQAVREVKSAK